jgi:hypothetical protein
MDKKATRRAAMSVVDAEDSKKSKDELVTYRGIPCDRGRLISSSFNAYTYKKVVLASTEENVLFI